MTRAEIISSAEANGYSTNGKTDEELLSSYAFFKAGFMGLEEELIACARNGGTSVTSFNTCARARFLKALDQMDLGADTATIWKKVLEDGVKKSDKLALETLEKGA